MECIGVHDWNEKQDTIRRTRIKRKVVRKISTHDRKEKQGAEKNFWHHDHHHQYYLNLTPNW